MRNYKNQHDLKNCPYVLYCSDKHSSFNCIFIECIHFKNYCFVPDFYILMNQSITVQLGIVNETFGNEMKSFNER